MTGTWVPFERGIELSAQYKVDHLLKPIFDYVPLSGDSPPPAPKHITAASTKPRTVPQRSQAAIQNHVPVPSRPSFPRQTEVAQTHFPEPIYSQPTAPPMPDSDDEEVSGASDGESDGSTTQSSHSRSASISSSARASSDEDFGHTNGRKRKHEEMDHQYESHQLNRPISKYSQNLLDYFVQSKVEELPNVLRNPPADFDVNAPIDDEGHSALHWASAMGRLNVVRLLCDLHADIFQANNEDQIPLVRSIMFTNNYDSQCFTDLITYLRPSIIHRNKSGRTVFHQIAIMTSHRSKWPASRYYLDALIKDLCGQSTQEQLQRLKSVLDYQDINGDTAITICARNQARKFCRLLLRANADIRIPNAHGRTAEEYIQEYESQRAQKRILRNGVPGTSYVSSSPVHQNTYQSLQPTSATFASTQRNPRGFQTYISESAIRATQKIIPQMTEHLESLATSFDAELVDKEADLTQAKHLLQTMEGEIETSRTALTEMIKIFQEVDVPPASEDVVTIGEAVLSKIQERVETSTKNLKMVVERGQSRDLALLVREEETSIISDSETKGTEEQNSLANELTVLQSERRGLVDRIVDIIGNSGCGEKMAGYRRLIALCIGQRTDQVDGLLEQLYQLFNEEEVKEKSGDVVMTGTE
jgi:transcription factor MBP1